MQAFEPNGTTVPKDLAVSGLETLWDVIEEAFRYSNEECLNVNPSLSPKDFFHEKLTEGTLSKEQKARVLLQADMWGSFIGDS